MRKSELCGCFIGRLVCKILEHAVIVFVFSSFLQESKSILSKYNRHLGRIGMKLGLTRHLTSYCSRHTWASACRDSGIPLSAISSSLGHTSEKTTQIYLSQMDCGVLDRENERMLKKLRERCLSL